MVMTPNNDQAKALMAITDWFHHGSSQPFVLGGLAGTGKTAMIPMLREALDVRTRYVCPTWKAAHVLTKKLGAAGIPSAATSIHNLIYNPRGVVHDEECGMWSDPAGGCTMKPPCSQLAWEFDPKDMPQLLVVDEASMVDPRQREDIERLGCPTVYVGDHGQLPPVNGTSIFDDRKPDAVLEAIQRQALDSPIIPLSRIVRDGANGWLRQAEMLGFPVYSAGKHSTKRYDPKLATPPHSDPQTVFIAATNAGVDRLNSLSRRVLGRGPEHLVVGDLVMAQNNCKKLNIYNGQQGVIHGVQRFGDEHVIDLVMETGVKYSGVTLIKGVDEIEGYQSNIPVIRHSYAVTCHKAQGSEFDNVIVYLANSRPETKSWLYTAITRARTNLTFVKAFGS